MYNVITVDPTQLNASEKLRTIKFDNHSGFAEHIYASNYYVGDSDVSEASEDQESIDSNNEKHSANDYPDTPEDSDKGRSGKKRKGAKGDG